MVSGRVDEIWVVTMLAGDEGDSLMFLQSHNPSGDCWTTNHEAALTFYEERACEAVVDVIRETRPMREMAMHTVGEVIAMVSGEPRNGGRA